MAVETAHPGGHKRDVIEVWCDHGPETCFRTEVVGRHGGNAEKVQQLLCRRGWSFTTDGHDFCPAHPQPPAPSAPVAPPR